MYKPYGASPNSYESKATYQQQMAQQGLPPVSAMQGSGLLGGIGSAIGAAASGLTAGMASSVNNMVIGPSLGTTITTTSGSAAFTPVTYSYTFTTGPLTTSTTVRPLGDIKKGVDVDKLKLLEKAESRKLKDKIPDSVVPISGWRVWTVEDEDGDLKLKALGCDTIWEPKKPIHATCWKNGSHRAPMKDCTCGVWSFKTMDKLVEAVKGYSHMPVIGKVSLWGKVIETTNGFRAEYAYPEELWLFDSSQEELSRIYDVPIRTI